MNRFVLLLLAGVFTVAPSAQGSPFHQSARRGTPFLATLTVNLTKSTMDCGTINYTAAAPFAAGSACPSGPAVANATAQVTANSGLTPFFITLTDVATGAANQCVLSNGGSTFPLDLALTVDGAPYSSGYVTPKGSTSDIAIIPSAHVAANTQAAGRYTGSTTFFVSF